MRTFGTASVPADLARNTQGVVAVANRMEVAEPSAWDLDPVDDM